MKVKNIMFSGFMAAVLMSVAGNASAAVSVASKAYVDAEVDAVEASVSNTYLTKEAAAETYATTQYVTENVTNVLGDETSGLVADVAANTSAIENLESTKANAADVYTKTEADTKFEEQAVATQKLTDAKAYTDAQIKTLTESLGGAGEDGEGTGLTGTVLENAAKITSLEDKVGEKSVADQITESLTNYATTEAVDTKLADYTKTTDMSALATAKIPTECQSESSMCVLSFNGTTYAWTPLTAPVDDTEQ